MFGTSPRLPWRQHCGARGGARLAMLPVLAFACLPLHAGMLVVGKPSQGGEFDLTQYEDFVHFVGTARGPAAQLGANGLPFGAVVGGGAFGNFENDYGNGDLGNGEISDELNARAVRLRYGAGVDDASRAYWFGDNGLRTGASFDVSLPATTGVLNLFSAGFCGRGTRLSASLRGASGVAEVPSGSFCGAHGAAFTVAWSEQQAGDTLSIRVDNVPLELPNNSGGLDAYGNSGVIGAYLDVLPDTATPLTYVLDREREGSLHRTHAEIREPSGARLVTHVVIQNEVRDSAIFNLASQTIDSNWLDVLFGAPDVAASTFHEVTDLVGVQRGSVRTTTIDANRFFPEASADLEWWDYVAITGGEGRARAIVHLDLHGSLGNAGGTNELYYEFSKRNLGGANGAEELLAFYYADGESRGGREFREPLEVAFEFEYGVPFELSSLMSLYANGNGSANFSGTIRIDHFELPAGALLESSGLRHGTVSPSTYRVTTANVPAPTDPLLAAAGLLGVLLRRRGSFQVGPRVLGARGRQ